MLILKLNLQGHLEKNNTQSFVPHPNGLKVKKDGINLEVEE